MQYNSVSEYFARLNAKSLVLLFASLFPLVVLVYLLVIEKLTFVMPTREGHLIGYVLVVAAWLDAVTAYVLATILLRRGKTLAGLGDRMDRYATVFYVRFAMLLSGSLMLVVAFFISGMTWIVLLLGAYLLVFVFSWPTRGRLCSESGLRESERNVIFEK